MIHITGELVKKVIDELPIFDGSDNKDGLSAFALTPRVFTRKQTTIEQMDDVDTVLVTLQILAFFDLAERINRFLGWFAKSEAKKLSQETCDAIAELANHNEKVRQIVSLDLENQ